MTQAIALTPEDKAILALESDTIAGHTCKVIMLGEPPVSAASLRDLVAARIGHAPALTRRLADGPDGPSWVSDEGFDLAEHVVEGRPAEPAQPDVLSEEVAALFAQHLDRERPLWQMDVIPYGHRRVLVWRIHHALADGTAAMRYARTLLWDATTAATPAAHRADEARRRAHLGAFVRREFSGSHGRSPFDGRIGTRRRVAFASAPLGQLHDAAKRLAGATLNDAVLSVIAGALRRWLEEHHGRLGDLRAKVPVSLHHEGDDAGNRDSFFCVELPLAEPDPVARLNAVHAATAVRKAEHDAQTMDRLLTDLGRVSPGLRGFCESVERNPRSFALNVSNVPGPREPVTVLGAPVETMHSIAEIGERHALRVAVVSLAGMLCFGFCADPAIVDDLAAMAEGSEAEASALIRAAA